MGPLPWPLGINPSLSFSRDRFHGVEVGPWPWGQGFSDTIDQLRVFALPFPVAAGAMPLPKLIFIITGLSLILGLSIWLIVALRTLYIQIAFTSPFLGNLLILVLTGLIGLLIFAFIYYANLITRKKHPRPGVRRPKLPKEKSEAASASLQALRQQLTHIQDEVAQRSLLAKSQQIETNLQKGNLQIMVFGTGSAGKTSLINALIGEMKGEVAATMGTTTAGETYRLVLPGVKRELLISDTPGILEMGVAGQAREQLARQLATKGDLLLFVVDGDLRQSEFQAMADLARMGKRSLLVFNKIDLYPEAEKNHILHQLRERARELMPPQDVLAIAANPQPVELPDGRIVEPEPEILPLLKHLATVLRAEGADLLADNILLQSQRLGEEARHLLDDQRRRQGEKVIERYQWIGAGVIAVTPLPVVDMLATAAVNAQMVVEIGRIYGCELNSERGKELALSLGRTLVSLGVVKGAIELFAQLLQMNVATYLVGKGIQGVTAAYLTRIAGKSFMEYFRHNQDWGDGGMAEVVQRQFNLSRKDEFVKGFLSEAIAKVVQPLGDWDEEPDLLPSGQAPGEGEDDWG